MKRTFNKNIGSSPETSVCEVCGEPATVFVNDQIELLPERFGEELWRCGEVHSHHAFCEQHQRPNILYRLDGSVHIATPLMCLTDERLTAKQRHINSYRPEAHDIIPEENYVSTQG